MITILKNFCLRSDLWPLLFLNSKLNIILNWTRGILNIILILNLFKFWPLLLRNLGETWQEAPKKRLKKSFQTYFINLEHFFFRWRLWREKVVITISVIFGPLALLLLNWLNYNLRCLICIQWELCSWCPNQATNLQR